ncbi:amino acid adenylation domain-containing protein [Clostridium sporogenes]|uniref:amino acid adenylation domain-containing protein n=1 Tax=Clostridium sporogenes TaxID=1509 RepID=UPI0005EE5157|nr:amino acid adenylation domain-containing protein [Clostridium sporogenes]
MNNKENIIKAKEMIIELRSIGVKLWTDNGKLRYRAPEGVFSTTLKDRVGDIRSNIVEVLEKEQTVGFIYEKYNTNENSPFPLTDVQSSYLLGKTDAVLWGGIGCQGYVEVNFGDKTTTDIYRVWRKLVERHDMLRASVNEDGIRILNNINNLYKMESVDIRGLSLEDEKAALNRIRTKLCNVEYDSSKPPLFRTFVTSRDSGIFFHLSIDLIIADFGSVQLLIGEMGKLLNGESLPKINIDFKSYALFIKNIKEGLKWQEDKKYWMDRIDILPSAPVLPRDGRAKPIEEKTESKFRRLQKRLDEKKWSAIKYFAGKYGVTTSSVILAAYAETIGKWSETRRFTLNLPLQNRLPVHQDVCNLVGDFTSVNLLEVDLTEKMDFVERVRKISSQLIEDIDHRYFTGVELMREIVQRKDWDSALMPFVFTGVLKSENMAGSIEYGMSQTPQVWVDCQAVDESDVNSSDKGLLLSWDVRVGALRRDIVDEAFESFFYCLEKLADSSETWVTRLKVPIISENKKLKNLEIKKGSKGFIQDNFITRALSNKNRLAVIACNGSITYEELLSGSLKIANYINNIGLAKKPSLIAIKMSKSIKQIMAAIGVLIAGHTYLPLDIKQPETRENKILKKAKIETILTEEAVDIALNFNGTIKHSKPSIAPSSPAYVIFTSGSTGEPKGVIVSHEAAQTTINAITKMFFVNEEDCILGLAELSFDLSVFDIFGVLGAGGTLVLPDPSRGPDPSHWAEIIKNYGVTLWNSVPAQAEMLASYASLRHEFPSIRSVWLSGDLIRTTLPDSLRKIMPNAELISLGGATEAGIWSIFHRIGSIENEYPTVVYGNALENQCVSVVDKNLDICPNFVPGEIIIGGQALAEGYLGELKLTKEKFLIRESEGGRFYRTGDRGRFLENGEIELLGRLDNQVKINGYRIELAEIEAALSEAPTVSDCTVVHYKQSGKEKLEAFIVEGLDRTESSSGFSFNLSSIMAQASNIEKKMNSDAVKHFNEVLNCAILDTAHKALREAGAFGNNNSWFEVELILKKLQVLPCFSTLLCRWLNILTDNGYIVREGNLYKDLFKDKKEENYWPLLRSEPLSFIAPECVSKYIESHARNICSLFSGKVNPLAFLFPDGSTKVAEALYGKTAIAQYLNEILSETIRKYSESKMKKISILEVGGGIGATTDRVLEKMEDKEFEYLFTDVSTFFLKNIKEKYPFIKTDILDLDQFESKGYFDIIIAAGVLNNTKNIPIVIKKLSEMIEEGGLLLITDPTGEHLEIFASQAFMMVEHEDIRKNTGNCFLTEDEWRTTLQKSELDIVAVFPPQNTNYSGFSHSLFVAQKCNCKCHKKLPEFNWRQFLENQLPAAMIPEKFHLIEKMPLTMNGKVDRSKLIEQARSSQFYNTEENYKEKFELRKESMSSLEKQIHEILKEISEKDSIALEENLLQIGFDSLLLAQASGKIANNIYEAQGLRFDEILREILTSPTIFNIASYIQKNSKNKQDQINKNIVNNTLLSEEQHCAMEIFLLTDDECSKLKNEFNTIMSSKAKIHTILLSDAKDIIFRKRSNEDCKLIIIACGKNCSDALLLASNMLTKGLFTDKVVLVNPTMYDGSVVYLGDVVVFSSHEKEEEIWAESVLGEFSMNTLKKGQSMEQLGNEIANELRLI